VNLRFRWWVRNWLVSGTPFPGGGLRTLWLRDYEELFYLGVLPLDTVGKSFCHVHDSVMAFFRLSG